MSQDAPGMFTVVILCAAIGTVSVVATLAWGHREFQASMTATEEYGKRLVAQTPEYLGPDAVDTRMRLAASRLACASCHIGAGAEPGELSLVAVIDRYPRISPRTGSSESIEDRINGCMVRSMNGKPLREDSAEMIAMVAWLRFLADRDAATAASRRQSHDPPVFTAPERAANPGAGERLFGRRCADCHGEDGAGLPASRNLAHGYLFPPLWGSGSFNDGAGMNRVLTAARFIKAKMPLGRPDLDDEQAFDVAAFINSKPRPHMASLERDYPDRSKKPLDTGYPPYADPFPIGQHRIGPFGPIEAYYRGLRKISR